MCPSRTKPYWQDDGITLYHGDCLKAMRTMDAESVDSCITSPPYWCLRDYGVDGQLGLEKTPEEYVASLVRVFREVWRVLRDDGTLWLNLGDSYTSGNRPDRDPGAISTSGLRNRSAGMGRAKTPSGLKPKDLVGIPWAVAFALRADGWYLRSEIIWHKPNPMPESVRDRPTRTHEQVFLLTKSARYFYDGGTIAECARWASKMPDGWDTRPGAHRTIHSSGRQRGEDIGAGGSTRNKRTVWTIATQPFPGAHFATFPPKLIEPCVLAGCPEGGTILDPFAGAATTGIVAHKHGRSAVLVELSEEYCEIAARRLERETAQLRLEV